jgi:hypothetical protein
MQALLRICPRRALLIAAVALGVAVDAAATRVGGAPAPSASAVQSSAQEPAHAQADDSASMRQGTVTALDRSGARVQVQGVWVELAAGKTRLLRHGQPAALETLRVGEPVRFIVASGSVAKPTVRVIYAP